MSEEFNIDDIIAEEKALEAAEAEKKAKAAAARAAAEAGTRADCPKAGR